MRAFALVPGDWLNCQPCGFCLVHPGVLIVFEGGCFGPAYLFRMGGLSPHVLYYCGAVDLARRIAG